MARLQISGQVRYANRAPAAQARVRVYDLDGLDNSGEHDFILDKSTNVYTGEKASIIKNFFKVMNIIGTC